MKTAAYVGRFAPSPTGLLHFGSLLAAMASYCDARSHNGTWRLRIDDIDPPRAIQNASALFQKTLHNYGFDWDGPIIFQSERTEAYRHCLLQLNDKHKLYLCNCSRRDMRDHNVYPGNCKPSITNRKSPSQAKTEVAEKLEKTDLNNAIRAVMDTVVTFIDVIHGEQTAEPGAHLGDTVVVRRDDLFAYALACAVDDADGISHVVRGADLLPTTAAQISIMELLGLSSPLYAHIPLALNHNNQKLSKQTQAIAIDTMAELPTLKRAWQALGQPKLDAHSVHTFWQAAIPAWDIHRVPVQLSTKHE